VPPRRSCSSGWSAGSSWPGRSRRSVARPRTPRPSAPCPPCSPRRRRSWARSRPPSTTRGCPMCSWPRAAPAAGVEILSDTWAAPSPGRRQVTADRDPRLRRAGYGHGYLVAPGYPTNAHVVAGARDPRRAAPYRTRHRSFRPEVMWPYYVPLRAPPCSHRDPERRPGRVLGYAGGGPLVPRGGRGGRLSRDRP
jgi:hypothetical protein